MPRTGRLEEIAGRGCSEPVERVLPVAVEGYKGSVGRVAHPASGEWTGEEAGRRRASPHRSALCALRSVGDRDPLRLQRGALRDHHLQHPVPAVGGGFVSC